MTDYRRIFEWLILAVFLYCGFILNIGNAPLFDLDEGAFSEATREMIHSGIWGATYLDGLPRFDKPILTYWLQAASVLSFGLNETALRLHSVISACLWATTIFIFVRQFINRNTAFAAVMIFSSTLMITIIGRAATADAVLNLFICLCMVDIYRYFHSGEKKYIYRCWLWISLGMLTKGPVAMLIPFLSTGIWLFSLKQFKDWLKIVFNPLGILILFVVLTPWLYVVWKDQGMAFFVGFLVDHNLNRFTSTREHHGGHLYYYFVALPLVLMPYSGMLQLLFTRFKHLWNQPLERLLIIWFLVVFILVSLSKTQLPHYVLYGVTPLIILFAKYRHSFNGKSWLWLFPIVFFVTNIGIFIYAHQTNPYWGKDLYIQDTLAGIPAVVNTEFLVTCSTMLLLLIISFFLRFDLWKKLVFAGLMQSLFLYCYLLPAFSALQQAPVKAAAEYANSHIQAPIVAYKIKMPSFSVYRNAITQQRGVKPGDYVFTRINRLTDLQQQFGAANLTTLFKDNGIIILHISKLP